MLVNNNIYNHMSAQFVPKKRETTHKSSELKAVYSNMSKLNKTSPLYLVSMSDKKQEHVIDIKEQAITLRDVAENFSNPDSRVYSEKTLYSSDESSVTGSFRRQPKDALPPELTISVDRLASEQVNVGEYLRSAGLDLKPGSQSFAIDTVDGLSQFNISVSEDDTNIEVQNRVAEAVNNRDIGINASIVRDGATSAIMLSSAETGASAASSGLHFSLKDENGGQGIVDTLGLSNVKQRPQNSEFTINGEAHSSTSNHISINQIENFVDAYNKLVGLAEKEGPVNIGSRSLLKDVSGMIKKHTDSLEKAGIHVDETGRLHMPDIDETNLFKEEKLAELFRDNSEFRKDINTATDRLTLDPIAYINKLIVTYPNKEDKTAGATYTQSLYSGLMYNNYA